MANYGKMTRHKRKALAMYADPNVGVATICAELKISRQRLAQIRKEFGVSSRPRGPSPKTIFRLKAIHRRLPFARRLLEKGMSVTKAAVRLEVPEDLLRLALQEAGVDVQRRSIPKKVVDRWVELYVQRDLSTAEIARLYKKSQSTVYNKLRDRGVLRSIQDTMIKYHDRARRGAIVRNAPAR